MRALVANNEVSIEDNGKFWVTIPTYEIVTGKIDSYLRKTNGKTSVSLKELIGNYELYDLNKLTASQFKLFANAKITQVTTPLS